MGVNCAPLLAILYLFSYEYDFAMDLNQQNKLHLARKMNSFCYIDDLTSVDYPNFASSIGIIYPKELKLKEITESVNTCSYLNLF